MPTHPSRPAALAKTQGSPSMPRQVFGSARAARKPARKSSIQHAHQRELGERRLAQEGQRPGRREPADGGSAPPGPSAALCACRAQGRRTRSGRSCRAVTLKEMKTLRAHGFSQRPRFEQVVGYLERNEPLPLDQPDRKAVPPQPLLLGLGRLRAVQRGPQPAASAAHSPEGDSRRGHGRGLGPNAPRRRKPLWRGRPRRRPRGRRADEQRTGPALHHGPSAQPSTSA